MPYGGTTKEREYQKGLMAKRRDEARNIVIDYSRQDKRRRARYRNNPAGFCKTYFPKVFYNLPSKNQKSLMKDFQDIIKYGGLLARADTRGEGKSTIGKVLGGVWAIVYGHIKYFVVVEVNMDEAVETLEDIFGYYVDEDLHDEDIFADDFPEFAQPLRAAVDNPQQARFMLVNGKKARMTANKKKLEFPWIDGKRGARIVPKGAEKPIRGLAHKMNRPDLVWVNDVETDATAASPTMTKTIRQNITKAMMGLGSPTKPMGVLMTGTIISHDCVIAKFTDPKQHPEWKGKRNRFFTVWPTAMERWDKYLFLMGDDPPAAYDLYKKNRKLMDAGAIISNPYRFIKTPGPDGKPMELSAIQHAFNEIYRMKMPAFMSEWQSDPPMDDIEATTLEAPEIQKKLTGVARGIVPADCVKLAVMIDVHSRKPLYWVLMGITAKGEGKVIDYNTKDVAAPRGVRLNSPDPRVVIAVEKAVFNALTELKNDYFEGGWPDEDGVVRHLDICLVDSGAFTDAVYEFCILSGDKYRPTKGFGSGRNQIKYRRPRPNNTIQIGHYWYRTLQEHKRRRHWLYCLDADYWKASAQEGFQLAPATAGGLALYGEEPIEHALFARQVLAEKWTTEFIEGQGLRSRWIVKQKDNHYLDILSGLKASVDMLGIHIFKTAPVVRQPRRVGRVGGQIRTKY